MAKKEKKNSITKILKEGVSVILPTYKGEKWILKCLDSLAVQTLDRSLFEVIIIINGEKDDTESIVDTFRKEHTDLNIIKLVLKKAGASHARNKGLEKSSRRYVTFVDDDDWVSENYLKSLYRYADKDTIVIAQIVDVEPEIGFYNEHNSINEELRNLQKTNAPIDFLKLNYTMSITLMKLVPMHLLNANQFDTSLISGEDVVLFTALAVKYKLNYIIIDFDKNAKYFRVKRKNSLSRKIDSFSFSVNERLNVIQKLNILLQEVNDKEAKDFIINKINAQASFIQKYIDDASYLEIKKIQNITEKLQLDYFPKKIFIPHSKQLSQLTQSFNEASQKYKIATQQINKVAQQRDEANQKYKIATQRIAKMTQQYHDAQSQIASLKNERKDAQFQIALLKNERKDAQFQIVSLKNELTQMHQRLQLVYASASYRLGHILIHEKKKLINPMALFKKIKTAKNMGNKNIQSKRVLHSSMVTQNQTFFRQKKISENIKNFNTDKKMHDLKIACIMDPFTYGSYFHEAIFQQLTPENWKKEIVDFSPDLLFIESAWRGKDELWWNSVGKKCDELIAIVKYCNEHNIPAAFWNKEDPVHFDTFINTASLFDFVFTTDIDMIGRYKSTLGHEEVYLLPFACQPKVNNPIEKYPRQDAFCFAGAYYVRYPDRTKDLDEFMLHLPRIKPVEIYDRMYGQDDPTYMFPEKFKQYIVGTLPFDQIDKAYKGYSYAINLNSIKQSQSMFARRVYEVLASNTITISNFSRAVRLLFGDLVFTSDSGNEILNRIQSLTQDDIALRKHKLIALRKVLSEHTYQKRLEFLFSKVFGKEIKDSSPRITMIAFVQNEEEYTQSLKTYDRQLYKNKNLLIVSKKYQPLQDRENIRLISSEDLSDKTIAEICPLADYISVIHKDDYYGSYYLIDLALATSYYSGGVIGKKSHYQHNEKLVLLADGSQYTAVQSLLFSASIVKKSEIADLGIDLLDGRVNSSILDDLESLATDEFNYCENGNSLNAEQITQIEAINVQNPGITIDKLESFSEKIDPFQSEAEVDRMLTGEVLTKSINTETLSKINFEMVDQIINLSSTMPQDKYLNIFGNSHFDVAEVGFNSSQNVYFDAAVGIDLQLLVEYNDVNKQKISHQSIIPNRNLELILPEQTQSVRFGFRVKGSGNATIYGLELGHRIFELPLIIGQAEHLVLTNIYPSYQDLYRNGFVHARVKAYKELGVNVDVFQIQRNQPLSFDEFENIDIIKGSAESLRNLLKNNHYKSVLVHFLDQYMWDVLKEYVDTINVYVWIHGSEIQPWHRREFNYTSQEELEKAKIPSAKRMKLWKSILKQPHPNLKLIFVSQYFAEEVQEDLELMIPDKNKVVIHNYVNTELFDYIPKDIEQRKKVLSIRPYASRKYANDLSVEAIVELSKKPFFNELEFKMVGDGILFDEVLEPLRKFSNVHIERRFLSQSEIAALHKEYGLFLTPTRMDAQGVSRDEAMSSGLIPLTNGVTAIPEFVDEECGILAGGDDAHDLAEGIAKIYEDPELFQKMSEASAKRVRQQCSFEHTIGKELVLFSTSNTQR